MTELDDSSLDAEDDSFQRLLKMFLLLLINFLPKISNTDKKNKQPERKSTPRSAFLFKSENGICTAMFV